MNYWNVKMSTDDVSKRLDQDFIDWIAKDFPASEQELVIEELTSITLDHVMARSQNNLNGTWHSILYLSKGDLAKLRSLVKAAKLDFRDVAYWAHLEWKEEKDK